MANAEQLSILKRGAQVWNGWRAKNLYVYADLNESDLNGVDLSQADLRIAHLRRANLFRSDLSGSDLSGADLSDADLREANLTRANLTKANLNGARLSNVFAKGANLSQANLLAANLRHANFSHANLSEANLMVANLERADFSEANLSKTNFTKADLAGMRLRKADLSGAKLTRANLTASILLEARFIEVDLTGANVSEARAGSTVFANSDLSKVFGLESIEHRGPSPISIDTFALSRGKISDVFLRGCGLSDADIEYAKLSNPDLGEEERQNILNRIQNLRGAQALQVSPLFIAYSDADSTFVDKVGNSMTKKGIRYWRNMHDAKAGQMEKQSHGLICQNPTVLLILSEHSLNSDWAKNEIRTALGREKEIGRDVLYPVALDESWKNSRGSKQAMEQITQGHIFDFSAWRNDSQFDSLLRRLIDGLELFHKGQ